MESFKTIGMYLDDMLEEEDINIKDDAKKYIISKLIEEIKKAGK
mgnify:CR=1 FL=1